MKIILLLFTVYFPFYILLAIRMDYSIPQYRKPFIIALFWPILFIIWSVNQIISSTSDLREDLILFITKSRNRPDSDSK